jgi:hypothetical protein
MDSPTETVITYDYIPAGEVKAAYQIEIDGKERKREPREFD